jgi:hypothetical protein
MCAAEDLFAAVVHFELRVPNGIPKTYMARNMLAFGTRSLPQLA